MAEVKALRLRRARAEDGRLLHRWRNESSARKASIKNQGVIPWREHSAWLMRRLEDPATRLYIVETSDSRRVGQVRLELGRLGWEVSISVAPSFRGLGIAPRALRRAAELVEGQGRQGLIAHIRMDNVASVIAFLKAGFLFKDLRSLQGQRFYRLVRPGGGAARG